MIWNILPEILKDDRERLGQYDRITSQLLFNRGITSKEAAERFLNADVDLYDSELLNGVKEACELILEIISKGEKIVIYGDYDVDGVSSTSILFDFLFRQLQANVLPYIPSRFEEGYGLNANALQKLADEDAKLIITVDCGIRDGILLQKFCGKKTKYIITDHHEPPADKEAMEALLSSAEFVIHPELSPELEFKQICATTVIWYVIRELSKLAQERGLISREFNPDKYLDLVAMATVCDVMPLVEQNRTILKKGVEIMKKTENIGLKELLILSGIVSEDISPYHLGYVLGPRLNAAGRLETAMDAVRLLTSGNADTSRTLAKKLSDLNSQRQLITSSLIEEAEVQLESWGVEKKLIFVIGNDWPEGIVGLVAGKLCEKYHKPVLVASVRDGKAVGSARSIKGFHITEAISQLSDLLERFGGHAQAAGFTLLESNIEAFTEGLLAIAEKEIGEKDLEKTLNIDLELTNYEINFDTIEEIEKFAPFGFGNKQPLVLLRSLFVRSIKLVGSTSSHLKLTFESEGQYIDGIGFNLAEYHSRFKPGNKVDIVGYPEKNVFLGNTKLQMKITDIRNNND
jgi:single-stranded-DNA-specific exonuclease